MSDFTRRNFLKTSAASAALAALGTNFAFAQGKERIKVGLIGCGGRGTGAARDAMAASPLVDIVAMGDLFKDRLDEKRGVLSKTGEQNDQPNPQYKVTDDTAFAGFDAYKKVIDSDVHYVILTTPPGFRPDHFRYAVEKGRHVFAEKPVATDPAGIRRFREAGKIADSKKLNVVGGFCFRRDRTHNETIKKIHDGAIGELVSGNCYYNVGYLWKHDRKPEWSDLEYQIRNWLYYTWLSGDLIVEQNIHRLDITNWVMKGPPVSAYGMGGRQVRTDPVYGNIYDHFAVEFEYANGAKVTNMCRQIDGTDPRVSEMYYGTKGSADPAAGIKGEKREKPDPLAKAYIKEHADLIEAMTTGKHVNESEALCDSTLTGIMGRMSAYTGKLVTWEQARDSKLDLWPKEPLAFGPFTVPPVAVPGKDPLV